MVEKEPTARAIPVRPATSARRCYVFLRQAGEQTHPRKGGVVKSRPLDGVDMNDPIDRRVKLAEWMTAADNPFFAKNIVNRFWGYTMGRGLVEPLDDVRATNPASNPELLDALAADFIKHKYDLKHLLRTIMNSRAYQLSSQHDGKNYEVDPDNALVWRMAKSDFESRRTSKDFRV